MSHAVIIKEALKRYGNFVALKGVSLHIEPGSFFTLLGPSGCGKTTLLRMIAGFNSVDGGTISFDEKVINDLPAHKRDIGMVFQNYAIFPHLTVEQNVAYGLKARGITGKEMNDRVEKALDLVQILPLRHRKPNELSGGQQQRVALARALVGNPKLLLLDEPLSNLDAKLRESMRFEIKEIQQKFGITVVYVTHDQTEAMAMSDKIILLNKGTIQQIGSPEEIYNSPVNQFVCDFLGKVNFIKAFAKDDVLQIKNTTQSMAYAGEKQGDVEIAVRPENIRISKEQGKLQGTVTTLFYLGDSLDLTVKVEDIMVRVIVSPEYYGKVQVGDVIYLDFDTKLVFEDNGTLAEQLKIQT